MTRVLHILGTKTIPFAQYGDPITNANMRTDTPFHETGHAYNSLYKKENPAHWQEMVASVKDTVSTQVAVHNLPVSSDYSVDYYQDRYLEESIAIRYGHAMASFVHLKAELYSLPKGSSDQKVIDIFNKYSQHRISMDNVSYLPKGRDQILIKVETPPS